MTDARRQYSLDCHQSNGFKCPMIQQASVSFHTPAIALTTAW